jgi:hypothetical protein
MNDNERGREANDLEQREGESAADWLERLRLTKDALESSDRLYLAMTMDRINRMTLAARAAVAARGAKRRRKKGE